MKYLSLLTLLLMLGISTNTQAQAAVSDNVTVTASANVVGAITVNADDAAITFPDILTTSTTAETVTPADGGHVTVTGATDGVEIDLELTFATDLERTGGSGAGDDLLAFTIDEGTQLFSNTTGIGRPTAADFSSAPTQTTAGTINAGITPTGTQLAIAIGGTVTPDGTQNLGSYSTDITVTFSYN